MYDDGIEQVILFISPEYRNNEIRIDRAQQSAAQYRRGNRKGQEIDKITCLHFSEKSGKQWIDQKNTK